MPKLTTRLSQIYELSGQEFPNSIRTEPDSQLENNILELSTRVFPRIFDEGEEIIIFLGEIDLTSEKREYAFKLKANIFYQNSAMPARIKARLSLEEKTALQEFQENITEYKSYFIEIVSEQE